MYHVSEADARDGQDKTDPHPEMDGDLVMNSTDNINGPEVSCVTTAGSIYGSRYDSVSEDNEFVLDHFPNGFLHALFTGAAFFNAAIWHVINPERRCFIDQNPPA